MRERAYIPSELTVESGIPISPRIAKTRGRRHAHKWPAKLLAMAPGDSVFVPGAQRKLITTISRAAKSVEVRATCRTVEGGIRVWRVE